MCEKRRLIFLPFFVLHDFSILIFATALSNLGISPLFALYMGYAVCVFVCSFTSIGFISHVGSRQVS